MTYHQHSNSTIRPSGQIIPKTDLNFTVEKKKIVAAIYLNQPGGKLVELNEATKHRYRKSQGSIQMPTAQPHGQSQSYFHD